MLQQVFIDVFDRSVIAGYCAIFVMIIRFFMKGLPRSYSYVLWAVVFLRLLVPSLPESDWSLIPQIPFVGQERITEEAGVSDITMHELQTNIHMQGDFSEKANMPSYNISMDYPSNNKFWGAVTYQPELPELQLIQKPVIDLSGNEKITIKIEPLQVSSLIWFVMSILFLLYGIISNVFFKRNLKDAEWVAPYTYEMEGLQTAFIMGLFRTHIYLPANLSEECYRYVIAHEETHRRRGDNLIKYIAFFLTCIHWFNPLVWLAFYFMCCDMEMSCDEQVLRTLGIEEKRAYSMALLSVASGRKISLGMPLAFSENSTKSRIMNVLKYRRPKFWISCASGVVIVAIMAGLLSNPNGKVIGAGAEPGGDSLDSMQGVVYEELHTESVEEVSDWENPLLNYVIPEEIDGKKVLTLGLPHLESVYETIHELVKKYNEQSEEYYIEIISFTNTCQQLEASMGDIMKMFQHGEGTDLLYQSFMEKEELAMSGVLVDLKEFITEEEWDKVYVSNVLEATTIGDKLYTIGPEFAIYTYLADRHLVEGASGWTAQEFSKYLEKKGDGICSLATMVADESYIRTLGNLVLDDFVDWEHYRCDFKTKEFYTFLELAKAKEREKNNKKTEVSKQEEVRLENVAKQEVMAGLITDVHDYQTYNIMYDERVQSMGLPTTKGSGVAAIMYDGIGISRFCDYKEAAWDFIKFYLAEWESYHAFPILQERLYAMYEKAKTPEMIEGQEVPKSFYLGIDTYAATNADVRVVEDLIRKTDREYHYNMEYTEILEEEIIPYYKDQISVEEAAARMEKRMNAYLEKFR